jgi:glutaminyl-tRNA synthetase
VERDDYREDAPAKWFRLKPGGEVRLKHAYFVKVVEAVKDAAGEVVELRCEYDPATGGGEAPDGRKVRGTLHWVSAAHAVDAEVRLYGQLFKQEDPDALDDFVDALSENSLEILRGCKLEPGLATAGSEERFQFLRHGYFCADSVDSRPGAPVFNLTVTLRDSWAKIEKKLQD